MKPTVEQECVLLCAQARVQSKLLGEGDLVGTYPEVWAAERALNSLRTIFRRTVSNFFFLA